MNGITAYVCFGKYGGFRCVWDAGIRITLGWIGFAVIVYDIERAMRMILDKIEELEATKRSGESNHEKVPALKPLRRNMPFPS